VKNINEIIDITREQQISTIAIFCKTSVLTIFAVLKVSAIGPNIINKHRNSMASSDVIRAIFTLSIPSILDV
jgi:hypothetical protein